MWWHFNLAFVWSSLTYGVEVDMTTFEENIEKG